MGDDFSSENLKQKKQLKKESNRRYYEEKKVTKMKCIRNG